MFRIRKGVDEKRFMHGRRGWARRVMISRGGAVRGFVGHVAEWHGRRGELG